ncbi:MAG: phytanoyl-CoA dioxygenase family protein [Pseudomonadota bacterium]
MNIQDKPTGTAGASEIDLSPLTAEILFLKKKLKGLIEENEHQKDAIRIHPYVKELEAKCERLQGELDVVREVLLSLPKLDTNPKFEDLALEIPEQYRQKLDRDNIREEDLSDRQKSMRRDGVLRMPGLISEEMCNAYWSKRTAIEHPEFSRYSGSYSLLKECRDVLLHPELVATATEFLDAEPALFLSLTGIKSSTRNWHQDYYLQEGYRNAGYVAVWVAVGDITEEMGPFQYVLGSHKWPVLRKELIFPHLSEEVRRGNWARDSEQWLASLCEEKINSEKHDILTHLPKIGEALWWHPFLLHRGSRPIDREILRPALIGHYKPASLLRAEGMELVRHENGGLYAQRGDLMMRFSKEGVNVT